MCHQYSYENGIKLNKVSVKDYNYAILWLLSIYNINYTSIIFKAILVYTTYKYVY